MATKLFSGQTKKALGDLKNTAVITPLKGQSVFVEKSKNDVAKQLVQPTVLKANIEEIPISTPESREMTVQHTKDDLDFRNERLLLSNHQFNLIFMDPINICPPSPTPLPESECPDVCIDVPYFDIETWDMENCGEYEQSFDSEMWTTENIADLDDLPPINFSLLDDSISP